MSLEKTSESGCTTRLSTRLLTLLLASFDPDKDAHFIRENRVGMRAPTTLAIVNGQSSDTRLLGSNWSRYRETHNGLLTILGDEKGPQPPLCPYLVSRNKQAGDSHNKQARKEGHQGKKGRLL
jgi:hypothetical protein